MATRNIQRSLERPYFARSLIRLENEGGVVATKAEVVRDRRARLEHLLSNVGHVVKVALGVRVLVVDRWWDVTGRHELGADRRLDAAGSTERVARHRFCRRYQQF